MATEQVDWIGRAVEETNAPAGDGWEVLDVRELGPPEPLKRTLETLAGLDAGTVLVQLNDRVPQHLYPKLDDRGFEYATSRVEQVVVTVIWRR